MSKLALTNLANLQNENTAVSAINANNAAIEAVMDNTLSRDGTSPNQMHAILDMNSNQIINLPAPTSEFNPLRLIDAALIDPDFITVSPLPPAGAAGQVLEKRSNADYDVVWNDLNAAFVFQGDNTGSDDVTSLINSTLAANRTVVFRDGLFKITGPLNLNNNQTVILSAGVTIQQHTASTPVFSAVDKTNISLLCDGAVLYGEGTYCGNVPQAITASCPTGTVSGFTNARGITLTRCNNFYIRRPHIKNFSAAGIYVGGGGANSLIDGAIIEGTNLYSTPIFIQANYQDCMTLEDSVPNGIIDGLIIINSDLSGTAQGITLGNLAVATTNRTLRIINSNIHDITGQHAFYGSSANVSIEGATLNNIALNGIKMQISTAGYDAYNFKATDIVAETLGGSMFDIGTTASGVGLHNVRLSGIGKNVNRGLSIGGTAGPLTNVIVDIQVEDCVNGIAFQDNGSSDIDIKMKLERSTGDGIVIIAENNDRVRFYPTLNKAGSTGRYGIVLQSATSKIELHNPIITDSTNTMINGINSTTLGGEIAVYGSAKITGASGYAIANTGHITAWPDSFTLQGTSGSFSNPTLVDRNPLGTLNTPHSDLFLKDGGKVDFGAGDIDIVGVGNGLSFQGAANGYIFSDGHVYPNNNGSLTLGKNALGWGSLFLGGATSGTGNLLPPAVAGSSVWTLPASTDTLVGRATTDTLTNKTISGSNNTITNVSPGGAAGGSLGGTFPNPTVVTNANLTGDVTSVGNATTIGTTKVTSAMLNSDVFSTAHSWSGGQAFTVPSLGAATATSINKVALTAPATAATLTIANNKTLTVNNSLTLAGTDATTLTFQGTDTYVGRATTDTLTNKTYDTAGTGNSFSINGLAATANTGTGSVARATSPTFVTPTLGVATATSYTGPSIGRTSGSAASAGQVGEVLTASLAFGSATALTTNTAKNVTSLTLTAGDWDVMGLIGITGAGTTNVTAFYGGLGTTSAILPPADALVGQWMGGLLFGGSADRYCLTLPTIVSNSSGSVTIYLVTQAAFTVSTCSAFGTILARRRS